MKFLHTADWQMGMKAAHVGAAGETVRAARLKAARCVVQTAADHEVQFVIITGDTFEDNAVSRVLVQQVGDILASCGRPVYIISGNHDPLGPGSVWKHPVWQHPNLHVLTEARPVAVTGAVLFPCPLFEKYSTSDATRWIDARETSEIAIGLAHGNVEGLPLSDPDYPIARDAAQRGGLDYLAVGHWHSFGPIDDGSGAPRIAYSGTHETTRFGERDSGNVVIVDIDGRGAPPKLTPVKTGGLDWITIDGEGGRIVHAGDLGRLRERVESMAKPQQTLLRIELSGILHGGDHDELERISEIVAAREFLYSNIDADALLPSPDDDSWLADVPVGVMKQVAERLRDLANPQFGGLRPDDAQPEVASRALMELYRLMHEVKT